MSTNFIRITLAFLLTIMTFTFVGWELRKKLYPSGAVQNLKEMFRCNAEHKDMYMDANGNSYDTSKGYRIPIYDTLPRCGETGAVAKVGEDTFYYLQNRWIMFTDSPNYKP